MGKALIITLIVLALLVISSVAIARYKGFCSGAQGRIERITQRIGKQLNLDDSQHQQLARFEHQIVLSLNELKRDRSNYVDQLIDILEKPEFDRELAHTLLLQKQAQLASLSSDIIDAFAEFSNNLDQSQRDKLQSMIMHQHQYRHCGFACGDNGELMQE